MSLLALICPQCAAPLPSGAEHQVLVCTTCARTWSVPSDGDELVPLARTLVRPVHSVPAGAELVLLPVWAVRLRVEAISRAPRGLPVEIRLPALGVQRLPLLMAFARNLTRAPAAWREWEGVQAAVDPTELSAEDAFALAETIVLRHVEGWPDDASLPDLEIPFGGARLLDWPCARFGSELIELVAGLSTQRALAESSDLRDRRDVLQPALDQLRLQPRR